DARPAAPRRARARAARRRARGGGVAPRDPQGRHVAAADRARHRHRAPGRPHGRRGALRGAGERARRRPREPRRPTPDRSDGGRARHRHEPHDARCTARGRPRRRRRLPPADGPGRRGGRPDLRPDRPDRPADDRRPDPRGREPPRHRDRPAAGHRPERRDRGGDPGAGLDAAHDAPGADRPGRRRGQRLRHGRRRPRRRRAPRPGRRLRGRHPVEGLRRGGPRRHRGPDRRLDVRGRDRRPQVRVPLDRRGALADVRHLVQLDVGRPCPPDRQPGRRRRHEQLRGAAAWRAVGRRWPRPRAVHTGRVVCARRGAARAGPAPGGPADDPAAAAPDAGGAARLLRLGRRQQRAGLLGSVHLDLPPHRPLDRARPRGAEVLEGDRPAAAAGRHAAAHRGALLPDDRRGPAGRTRRHGVRPAARPPPAATPARRGAPAPRRRPPRPTSAARLRRPVARRPHDDGLVDARRPLVQPGHGRDHPRGQRARLGRVRPGRGRGPARAGGRRGARPHGHAPRLEELRLRRHGREHPAPGRRLDGGDPRLRGGHRARAAAVPAQGQGPDRDGARVRLCAGRDAVRARRIDGGPERELHGAALHHLDGAPDDGGRPHQHLVRRPHPQEDRELQGM
ncbi:MAG: hypothetical protein AVDCRST_MAG79-2319, partial [uncultured Thermoleophilia bacterium]